MEKKDDKKKYKGIVKSTSSGKTKWLLSFAAQRTDLKIKRNWK